MTEQKRPLWTPPESVRYNANMTRFIAFVNERHGLSLTSYQELYSWSIEKIPDFWADAWDFTGIKCFRKYDTVIDDLGHFPGAKWFVGARLNFAENLLSYRDDYPAFIFHGENVVSDGMTYGELYDAVARLATSLKEMGITPGDRVAAYMPNLMETAIAMLATTSIGAVWSSCATDLGPGAVLDRLGQIEPKVLFVVDGYFYKGKAFSSLGNAAEIACGIPSLQKVVVVHYSRSEEDISSISKAVTYEDFISSKTGLEIEFAQLPFSHPLVVMFSSGTTGKPKCIVQSAGGILLNHRKELVLHVDLKRDDRLLYITTCSWMMWNWMLSALGVGATVVLYDGNALYPDTESMFRLIEKDRVTVFGTSATFLNFCRSEGIRPMDKYALSSLRGMCQTGSVLSVEGFEYVYQAIKKDLHFNSISGGTDINGCFAIGCPLLPVYAGELQAWGLGMKMNCYDDTGMPVTDLTGELVCEAPSPSMPLYFWNDPDNGKYLDAYFDVYPGVWRHGDYVQVNRQTGGITFFGRSDALLKPSGVRIGTAEIYNVLEQMEEIADSVTIGQSWEDDQRVILFIKPAEGYKLTEDLKKKIRMMLKTKASPRHVPARILAVSDVPYTHSGKKVETAITRIIHGKPVLNRDALSNPESLEAYAALIPELTRA